MMQSVQFVKLCLVGLLCLLCAETRADANDSSPKKNWVKWHAKKTMFLFRDKTPIGINEHIKTSLITQDKRYQLQMHIPLDRFDSGEKDRDVEVAIMLKSDVQKELIFTSQSYSREELMTMLQGGQDSVDGELQIAGVSHPVRFNVKVVDGWLTGEMTGKLSDFAIKPPRIVGGLIVQVADYLKLSVQLNLQTLAAQYLTSKS